MSSRSSTRRARSSRATATRTGMSRGSSGARAVPLARTTAPPFPA